jgi:hypothetical protein
MLFRLLARVQDLDRAQKHVRQKDKGKWLVKNKVFQTELV